MQDSTDYKWVSLCLIILSSIVFLEVLVLFIFHLYVKYHLETSTYDYLKAEINAQSNKVEDIPRQSKRESVKVHTIKNVHVQPGTSEIYEVTAGSLQREIVWFWYLFSIQILIFNIDQTWIPFILKMKHQSSDKQKK